MRSAAVLLALTILSATPGASPAADAASAPTSASVRRALGALAPSGASITDVQLAGVHATVRGEARSNAQVSDLLRKVDGAGTYGSSTLVSLVRAGNGMNFTMTLDVACPKPGATVANNPCDSAGTAAPTIYKCTAGGVTTYQSTACPAPAKR